MREKIPARLLCQPLIILTNEDVYTYWHPACMEEFKYGALQYTGTETRFTWSGFNVFSPELHTDCTQTCITLLDWISQTVPEQHSMQSGSGPWLCGGELVLRYRFLIHIRSGSKVPCGKPQYSTSIVTAWGYLACTVCTVLFWLFPVGFPLFWFLVFHPLSPAANLNSFPSETNKVDLFIYNIWQKARQIPIVHV